MGAFKPYSPIPPSGYVCKLCFVPGHWLKNCSYYIERKREQLLNYLVLQQQQQQQQKRKEYAYSNGEVNGGNFSEDENVDSMNSFIVNFKQQQARILELLKQGKPIGFVKSSSTMTPPETYICRKCNTPGHW